MRRLREKILISMCVCLKQVPLPIRIWRLHLKLLNGLGNCADGGIEPQGGLTTPRGLSPRVYISPHRHINWEARVHILTIIINLLHKIVSSPLSHDFSMHYLHQTCQAFLFRKPLRRHNC